MKKWKPFTPVRPSLLNRETRQCKHHLSLIHLPFCTFWRFDIPGQTETVRPYIPLIHLPFCTFGRFNTPGQTVAIGTRHNAKKSIVKSIGNYPGKTALLIIVFSKTGLWNFSIIRNENCFSMNSKLLCNSKFWHTINDWISILFLRFYIPESIKLRLRQSCVCKKITICNRRHIF